MTYRAAIIGCGKIGSEFADDPRVDGIYTHAGAYTACESTGLVAVCDNDAGKAKLCAERWGVGLWYTDPVRLLAEAKPDIVSICTPDSTHADLAGLALDAPGVRAVFAEKPLALDVPRAERLVELARRKKIVLAVNYTRRFAPSHVAIKKLLDSGAIGRLQHVTGWYTKGLLHNGTHWIDLCRWLAGEIREVQGFDAPGGSAEDPTYSAWLRLDSGCQAFLHGCDASKFSVFEMDLVGESGRLRILDSGQRYELYSVCDSPRHTGYRVLALKETFPAGFHDVLLHAVRDVVHSIETGKPPLSTGEDGVAALRVAADVRDSARKDR